MEKLLNFKTSENHYHAQACIVWCFDDRFSPALSEISGKLGLKNYDLVKVAGGAKSLCMAGDSSEKDFILSQIKISIQLHGTKKVILMNHSDCGAYGGLKNFGGDDEKEKNFHEQELTNAKEFLAVNLPKEVSIEAIFVDFEDIYQV